jgi:hypothetical protein
LKHGNALLTWSDTETLKYISDKVRHGKMDLHKEQGQQLKQGKRQGQTQKHGSKLRTRSDTRKWKYIKDKVGH